MKGFTILELLIVMTLAAVVAAMGMINFSRLKRQEDLPAIVVMAVQLAERARSGSVSGKDGRAWKVMINPGSVSLADDQNRIAETYQVPNGYSLSGPVVEVEFGGIDGVVQSCVPECMFVAQETGGSLNHQWQILASGAVEY